ncbi:hypothetical protein BDN71DRAFT_1431898 [Pleurotus eryngii]|uniref:Uncharacterized protein n=1 Tax=Pleurotus eryngii TaxID=5323 RepID=A0A9P5ZU04_PLEER|nr:hypothetical protein BDN71DRAFT_1431898 [Pleurotus eryngii]
MKRTLNVAPIEDVQAFKYNQYSVERPILENFVGDLAQDCLEILWNKRLTELFVQSFIEQDEYSCKDPDKIAKCFRVHLIQLQKRYRKLPTPDDAKAKSCKNRQRSNTASRHVGAMPGKILLCNVGAKLYLPCECEDREGHAEYACMSDDGLKQEVNEMVEYVQQTMYQGMNTVQSLQQPFAELLRKIPYYGMSGDETDINAQAPNRNGKKTHGYSITQLPWHSSDPQVTHWFQTFDRLHLSMQFMMTGNPMPGEWLQIRLPSSRIE